MKIEAYLEGRKLKLEVYKVQVALFGGPSILIYNEDKTQMYETSNRNEVNEMLKFIGKGNFKVYACGNRNSDGKITLMQVIPNDIAKDYNW